MQSEKPPLFIVTSIVCLPRFTIFNYEQRYYQTIETIKSIRHHVPNAKIVILEASPSYKVEFPDLNVMTYYVENPEYIMSIDKSVGEATIIKEFLSSSMFNSMKHAVSLVIKLSGRYVLNYQFSYHRLRHDKITVRRIFIEPYRTCNPDLSACVTILFSFPPEFTYIMQQRLDIVIEKCWGVRCNIEQSIFYGTPDTYMNYIDHENIGVEGIQAPDGNFVSY